MLPDPSGFKARISSNEFSNTDTTDCLMYLEEYCDKRGFSGFSDLQLGEKSSAALSLYLSINQKRPPILLTDDHKAEATITLILQEQKFGIVKTVPDFIIHLYKTNYDLTRNQIRGALQTYYNIKPKPDVARRIFDKRMSLTCRDYWISVCGLRCC